MKYKINFLTLFKKDMKHVLPRDLAAVKTIISLLQYNLDLPVNAHAHKLSGNYFGWIDCHVKPDLVLIYRFRDDNLDLYRIGSHSRLFGW